MLLLRDNTARAKQAISIFWIMLGFTILNMFSLGWQYYLLIDVQANPGSIDMEMLRASDTIRTVVTVVNFIMLVVSMILFIMWFRRAYYNLHCLSWHNARHSEGWAAGSWFIPILSLFWPYQIMILAVCHGLLERKIRDAAVSSYYKLVVGIIFSE